MKKEWLMLFRYPVPADLESYFENASMQGEHLKKLEEKNLFFYEFEEAPSARYRYMVDITALPKAMYMETLLNDGWEYLGTSRNCYFWRKEYSDNVRPKDMSDRLCLGKHCRNAGILALIMAIALLAISAGLIWGYNYEIKMGAETRHIMFIVEAIINLPFCVYAFWAARTLFKGANRYL